jgi:hypothetical protein
LSGAGLEQQLRRSAKSRANGAFATAKVSAFHPKTADESEKFPKHAVGTETAILCPDSYLPLLHSAKRGLPMNKHEAAKAQPGIEPNTNKENRLNTPNDKELQVDWQKKKGDGDKSRNLRGNDAKRLKHGEKGV